MEVLLRSLYGATAVMAVPRWHCGSFEHVQSFRRVTAKVLSFEVYRGATAINDGTTADHGDHGGATAVYAVRAPQWHRASGVTGVEGPRF